MDDLMTAGKVAWRICYLVALLSVITGWPSF